MIRLLMRRDYTHSICANHYVYPAMELRQHGGSEKAFVWQTLADFADGLPKEELLAIRFRVRFSCRSIFFLGDLGSGLSVNFFAGEGGIRLGTRGIEIFLDI